MFRKQPSALTNAVSDAVEPLATPEAHPTIRSYQAVASALGPAVFPTERWRKDTKDAMLREFARPKGEGRADAGSHDGLETSNSNVVRVENVVLADVDTISPEQAADAAVAIEEIIARHESRQRHS